jgi:hypothetical protein
MPLQEIKRIEEEFEKTVKGTFPSDMTLVEISRPEWENFLELNKSFLLHHCAEMYEKGRLDEQTRLLEESKEKFKHTVEIQGVIINPTKEG